jgi:hypothetical protein
MKFRTGNLLDYAGENPVVITTNGTIRRNGMANLGSGNARDLGKKFEWLAQKLGYLLDMKGNHVHHMEMDIISFPVEHSWQSFPEIELIRRSAAELISVTDKNGWKEVYMPLPGCGKGGLKPLDIIPILAPLLDDRFIILNREGEVPDFF